VFGSQEPGDYWNSFTSVLDGTYNELVSISPLKPIAVVEFGVTENPNDVMGKARWIQEAFFALKAGWYPHVKAISYWHERSWSSDPRYSLRIDSSLNALNAYRAGVGDAYFVSPAEFTAFEQSGEGASASP